MDRQSSASKSRPSMASLPQTDRENGALYSRFASNGAARNILYEQMQCTLSDEPMRHNQRKVETLNGTLPRMDGDINIISGGANKLILHLQNQQQKGMLSFIAKSAHRHHRLPVTSKTKPEWRRDTAVTTTKKEMKTTMNTKKMCCRGRSGRRRRRIEKSIAMIWKIPTRKTMMIPTTRMTLVPQQLQHPPPNSQK